jgi:geranylgeranyl diphosphate synthase type II
VNASVPAQHGGEAPFDVAGADAVDAVLRDYFSAATARAALLGEPYAALWRKLEESAGGGKRFRPRLVLAVCAAYGGTDMDAAARVGAAFELLHTALIVHDDVIDRDG